MSGNDRLRLATSEQDFRLYMIDHAARMEEHAGVMKDNCGELFRRVNAAELRQAGEIERVNALEKTVDSHTGRASGFGAAAGMLGGFLGGLLQALMGVGKPQ